MNTSAFTHENLEKFIANPSQTITVSSLICEAFLQADKEERSDALAALFVSLLRASKHFETCDSPTFPMFALLAPVLALGVFTERKEIGRG